MFFKHVCTSAIAFSTILYMKGDDFSKFLRMQSQRRIEESDFIKEKIKTEISKKKHGVGNARKN